VTSPVITNSLLRLDGVTGEPPSPFERPNNKMAFFVLELGLHDNVGSWCTRTAKALRRHAEFLRQKRAAGAELTLFVESALSVPVLRFDAGFLGILAAAGISLECSHEPA
jgi:hypothetical protein